jgi:hypothetical protein
MFMPSDKIDDLTDRVPAAIPIDLSQGASKVQAMFDAEAQNTAQGASFYNVSSLRAHNAHLGIF